MAYNNRAPCNTRLAEEVFDEVAQTHIWGTSK